MSFDREPRSNRRSSCQTTREECSLVDETEFIAKGVRAAKASFAPGLRLDGPKDGAVRPSSHAAVVRVEIVYREVHMVRIRPGVPSIAVSSWVKAGENDAAALEVMPPGRDPDSWLLLESRVRDCGVLERSA